MSLFRHTASLLRRTESLQAALTAAAFWTLAAIALAGLRDLHLWGMPQVVGVTARATMACVIVLAGMAGIRCLADWPKSGLRASVLGAIGGMPGLLLIGAVASYLAIGVAVMDDADWTPDMAATVRYAVLCLGVLVAAAVGGRAMSERVGADRLLRGVLVVLIGCCAVILASPVLRDLGVLAPYRLPFRLTGAFTEPNNAGLVACMTAALAAALLTNGGPRRLGWLGLAAGVAAALGTASRTALVVLGALAVLFLLLNLRSRPRALVPVAAGVVLAGIAGFVGLVGFSGGFSEWSRLRYDSAQEGNLLCDPSPTDRRDCAVLLAVRDMLAGDIALNWSRTRPVERWQGVTTAGPEGRVTGLRLAGLGLNGRIPPELGRLDRLESLSLQRNRLTGGIPPELGDLASLERLVLSFNALSGPIPPELGKLPHLRELWLKDNRLTGPVPPELEGLDKLAFLRLAGNDLDRPYPQRLFRIADHDLFRDGLRRGRPRGDAGKAETADVRETESGPVCRPGSGGASGLDADCGLLLANRDLLAGGAPLNWSEDIPIDFWRGVTVGGSPKRVTALELPRAELDGRLFAALGELSGLVALDLSHNRLTGPAPPELERLDKLAFLRLAGNNLDRPFPPALRRIADHDLDMPDFCRPQAVGPGLLADCALLLSARDTLAGDAPLNWRRDAPVDDWQGVTVDRSRGRVAALDLTQMGLNGRIPAELGRLAGLVSLRLSRNRLAGGIPPELGKLAGLRVLALDGNFLTGPAPPEIGKLSKLIDLRLNGNPLTGPASDRGPDLLCRSSLEGRLHDDCALLLEIRDELAGDVELNWSEAVPIDYWRGVAIGLPAAAGEAGQETRVIALDLSHMGLNGRIPARLAALDALAVLRLGDNRLAGAVPPELGALAGLRTLTLENNALTGKIPPELGALKALVSLRLGGNALAGRTRQFTALANLRVLALENNMLTGNIHPRLGGLKHLEELRLENNRLHGTIPGKLGRLSRLAVLRLGGNVLTGCVPAASRAARVRRNDLASAGLICESPPWSKPGLFDGGARLMRLRDILAGDAALDWSYDRPVASWEGVTIGNSGRVAALDLRDRNLTGRIPPELGELGHLRVLRLDGNRLTGPIPPELGKLTRLTMLSLEGNRLTGPIPPEVANLPMLRQLWLANNRLTGSIPFEWARVRGVSLAVAGNDLDSCMAWELHDLRSSDIDDGIVCTFLEDPRLLLWRLGFEKAMEAPVFGHGFRALKHLEDAPIGHHGKPLGAHNLYLTLLGEAGIVPLLLFLSAIVLLLRAQWGAPKSLARDATVAWIIVIALSCMIAQHLLKLEAFMFLAGLSVATGAVRSAGDRRPAKA